MMTRWGPASGVLLSSKRGVMLAIARTLCFHLSAVAYFESTYKNPDNGVFSNS